MSFCHRVFSILVLSAACFNAFASDHAVDACDGFKWDVSNERRLFASPPVGKIAGKQVTSAPVVRPDRLYQLKLTPQDAVLLTESPVSKAAAGPAFAGIVTLVAPTRGSYRISIDGPYWLDVLSNGSLIAAKDFASVHGCRAPRKIVIFELPAPGSYGVQVSNADQPNARMAITTAPPRTR